MHRLEAVQGRMVLRVLKLWRKHSGRRGSPGEGAFSEVTAMVDRFLRNDRIRREKLQAEKRAAAAGEAASKVRARPGPTQTAAPVTNEPEDVPEDWMAREGRLAQYGDLGMPGHDDPSKRGFEPK